MREAYRLNKHFLYAVAQGIKKLRLIFIYIGKEMKV